MFHHANWISSGDTSESAPAPFFRKKFYIEKGLKSAEMAVCGLGMGMYYLNGAAVTGDVLLTPITKYDSRVLFNRYTVTGHLQKGENVFGAVLGNGLYHCKYSTWNFDKAPWRDVPKMLFCLTLTFQDGTVEKICSDTTWKTHPSPTLWNEPLGGEEYDAAAEQPGWNDVGFDDSAWRPTKIAKAPGGILIPMELPPIRITKRLTGQKVSDTVWDFGENLSGWVKIRVRGQKGASIKLEFSEIYRDGEIDPSHLCIYTKDIPHGDSYHLKGGGIEEWAPMFQYHGFRWCRTEIKGEVEILSLCAEVLHTDLPLHGDFSCSDDMLNQIHAATGRTTLGNFHGLPTDCPHREQNGWTGDACVSAEQCLMNYEMVSAYQKWMNDFKDVQRPSGQLPGIVPTGGWGYNWGSGPAWDSALILIPYYVYRYTGTLSLIAQMWENMNRYMDYIDSMATDYLCCFGLGDWCPPPKTKVCPTELTDTAYYYVMAKTMSECAALMKEEEAGERYRALAEHIRQAFRRRFWLGMSELFETNQTAVACAIYQGLLNADEIPGAAARLASLVRENDYHIDCGMLGTKYIFSALSENGYADVAYRMVVNPTMPSYAYWINNGLTTLGERWNLDVPASRFHHMFSEVDLWFYRHLAGIQPLESGFAKVKIEPCFVEGIHWVKARHKGISVMWDETALHIVTPVPALVMLNGSAFELPAGTHTLKRR